MNNNTYTVICGHYGCGKTNLSLNLAIEKKLSNPERRVIVVDIDIVNPYFRSSEYSKLLLKYGIELIIPSFAGTTLDTPTLSPKIFSIFTAENADIFIDAGGDDAGATALGTISRQLKEQGYEMIYVINKNRVLASSPENALILLREIEAASRLNATAIVNNTHLGVDSTFENSLESESFAKEVSKEANLPLLYSTVTDFALNDNKLPEGFKKIERLVLFPWEMEEE